MQANYEARKVDGILVPSRSGRGAWRDLGTLRNGDVVLARLAWSDEGDHFTARVIRRLSRERPPILGVFRREGKGGTGYVDPVDKRDRNSYLIPAAHVSNAKDGDLVTAEMLTGGKYRNRQAKVTANHGKIDMRGGLSLIAVHERELPLSFSREALQESDALEPILFKENDSRLDLRDMPLVTIDPEDARDHDDAVWAQADDDPANPDGWIVFVAIADVAAYVIAGSALDRDARERGNSTYFPDGVLPMLPERLSADLCSLRAGEERPCMVARLVFDRFGRKRAHSFCRAMMKSTAALSYEQAQAAIDGKPDAICKELMASTLEPLWEAYRALAKAREQRQPLELEMPEYRIRLEEDGAVTSVAPVARLDAHRLVEEFMIAANSAVAQELAGRRVIHRVHESPNAEKSEQLREFLRSLELRARLKPSPKPKDFNDILRHLENNDIQAIVGEAILRSQSQAFYGTEALGHFGLQLRYYAHFTSPIRRYADLTVHRELISMLQGEPPVASPEQEVLEETAAHISETERRSVAAERDTSARYMAAYFCEHIGARLQGRIMGMSRAGLFIRPEGSAADGFAPVARLPGGFFRFEPNRFAMVEQARKGSVYRIGDAVKVEVVEAEPLTGGLIFDVLPESKRKKHRP